MEGMEGMAAAANIVLLQRYSFFSNIPKSKVGKTTFMPFGTHGYLTQSTK